MSCPAARCTLGALAALLLLSPGCTASRPAAPTPPEAQAPAPGAPAALSAFVDTHLEEEFRRFPLEATSAGIHTYDAELRGFTAAER
ncbi:MAG TPA: DUF885 domain-containing protein, partial [Aggregicoccus sp.]|nr:DUF885 domain-containing protein [Aggregicoccus sp.]